MAGARTTLGNARACLLAGVATVAVAVTIDPLIEGSAWLAPTVVAVLGVTIGGVLCALGRAHAVLAVAVTALVGFVILNALFAPSFATFGGFVPTPASYLALADLVVTGIDTSNRVVVPAPDGADIQALVAVATTVVAFVVQALAVWARLPGVAGLPLLLTVCVPAALAPAGIGVQGFVIAALGFLALTLTDADERIRQWGPLLRRRATTTTNPAASAFAAPALLAGVVALVVAVVLPTVVPGLGRNNLNEVVQDTFGEGGVQRVRTVNPFVNLGTDLNQPDDVEVLTYVTDVGAPAPLRIVTTDVVDSQGWGPSTPEVPVDQTVEAPLPRPPGAGDDVLAAAPRVLTDIQVTGLEQLYLPLPYPASTIDIDGTWLYDPLTLNVFSGTDNTLGKTYSVSSYDISPDAQRLRDAPPPPGDVIDRYTTLPDLPASVAQLAAEVTAGAPTAYDQASALQAFFRTEGGFVYDLDVANSGDIDATESFLLERRGFCAQFSSSMALMARSLGIPARVAVGFLPGEPLGAGVYSVSIRDAHAWPELYFEGVGWVRFEPTPATRTGAPPTWSAPDEAEPSPEASASIESSAQPSPTPTPTPTATEAAPAGAASTGGSGWAWVLPVLLALAAGAVLAPRGWRRARDVWRWRRHVDDARASADVAWAVLAERAADLGWNWGQGTVRREASGLVAGAELTPPGRDALWRLVEAAERSRFAARPLPSTGLRDDVATVLAELADGTDRNQRMRARWLPTPWPRVAARIGEPRPARSSVT